MVEILRYAAFTTVPEGGNPAGVVLDATGLTDEQMQELAAEVGFSETAFLVQAQGDLGAPGAFDVRYFSPRAEVPFCGHATIASAVALHDHGVFGPLTFRTASGEVPVLVTTGDGEVQATLTSVVPTVVELAGADRIELLAALGWAEEDLDPALPLQVAYAGAWHPIVAVRSRQRLAALDYDVERLGALMAAHDWTTVQCTWRDPVDDTGCTFHARDPFPPGGVLEDPATGAAAAALGAHLRANRLVVPPATITVHQGEDMGRPSTLRVGLAPGDPRVRVTGGAVPIE